MILGTIVILLLGQGPLAQSVVFESLAACEEATARVVADVQEHPEAQLILAECRKI